MKQLTRIVLYLAVAPILFLASCQEIPVNEEPQPQQTYIVELNLNNINTVQSALPVADKIKNYIKSKGIASDKVSFIYEAALTGFAAELTEAQVATLKADKAVTHIEKDKIVTLDLPQINGKPTGGGTTPPAQQTPWGITDVGSGSPVLDIRVWVIDTGIDLDHPDLNVNKTNLNTTVFTSGKDSYSADDGNGHGSHVSGIIGAKDDAYGVVGVAPGVELVAVKVLNSQGSGTISGVIKGVDYVALKGKAGDVANMSLGGGVSTSLDNAIKTCANLGIYFSLAAGNESMDAENTSPARTGDDHANIITVSAHDGSDKFAYFSNYGNAVEWCAPGVSVYSTYKGGKYATLSGTSMAAPHVAGIMAVSPGGPGNIGSRGSVTGDKDSNPDPLAKIK